MGITSLEERSSLGGERKTQQPTGGGGGAAEGSLGINAFSRNCPLPRKVELVQVEVSDLSHEL